MRALLALAAVATCSARAAEPTAAWYAHNVEGYARTATGDPPDTTLAYDLEVAGGVARWHECTAIDACTGVERERPAGDLLAIDHAGRGVRADGREVEVVRLTLAPGKKYVVPITKTR